MNYRSHLQKDKILAAVMNDYDVLPAPIPTTDLFSDIVSSIVGQQLSTKAADTIWNRFKLLFGRKKITPKHVLQLTDEEIRGVGVSYSKVKYIKGLAQMITDREVDLELLPTLSDKEVIDTLTKVKGIGPWTAEMILMFSLGREDVFSYGDLGLRSAIAKLYGIDRDDIASMQLIVEKWSPYRTYASRYLWKSLDNAPKRDGR